MHGAAGDSLHHDVLVQLQVSHSKLVYMYDLYLVVSSAIYAQTVAILFLGAIAYTRLIFE